MHICAQTTLPTCRDTILDEPTVVNLTGEEDIPLVPAPDLFAEAPLLAEGWTDKVAVSKVITPTSWYNRWESDAFMFRQIAFWETLATESPDKAWCFFCLVCGFCNELYMPESFILSLADAARGIIHQAIKLRSHAGDLRHSIPEEDNAEPPIVNMPLSTFTLPLLVSLLPQDIICLFHHYNIDDEMFDNSGLTRSTIKDYRKLDAEYWLSYCTAVQKFLSTLFNTGLHWRALATIQEAYQHGDPKSIAHEDARRFLGSSDPANYHDVDAYAAEEILRGMVHATFQFQRYCPDYLRRKFPSIWLVAMEYWMTHEFKPSGITHHRRPHRRQVASSFMSLSNILLHGGELGLLHYYSCHTKFQRLFPTFVEHQWVEQVQMALSFWHVSNPLAPHMPAVTEDLLVLMVHLGGCFPLPTGRQPLNRASVLISPHQNYVKMLREGRNRPDQLLQPPPLGCSNPDLYAEWLAEPRRHSRSDLLRRYEATISIESPTGRPEPVDTTHTVCFDQAHYHTTAHSPDHPATATWATVQAWYDEPYTVAITNSAKYPSPSFNVRTLNNMLTNMTDLYVLPTVTWSAPVPTRTHAIAPAAHSRAGSDQGLPMPITARQPLHSLPLSTTRSTAPAVDLFALTFQAPANGRLENIQPDFSSTNRFPMRPLNCPIPDQRDNSAGTTSPTPTNAAVASPVRGPRPPTPKSPKSPKPSAGHTTRTNVNVVYFHVGYQQLRRFIAYDSPHSHLTAHTGAGPNPLTGMDNGPDPGPDTRPMPLGLKVWFNTAPEDGAEVLVVIPLSGEPALVNDPRITWDILCGGALAKYTVTQRLPDGGPQRHTRPRIRRPAGATAAPDVQEAVVMFPFTVEHDSRHSHGNTRTSPSSRRKRGTSDKSGSDSDGSRSDAGNDATTTFRDAAHRTIKRVKGSSMQVIRASEPLRAFATPARVDALLATVGNEINNYSSANFIAGATDLYINRQVSSGATDRDPSWYNLPPYYKLVWWVQRETNSAIATQIVYGNWTMARSIVLGSLRLFHFLPAIRANFIGNNHFKCTHADWVLAFRD
ncbi:hypothetical protein B484DRAFT_398858 [Ochromonadaceae sp. CCMP2298]|nr:hypothetical protein B484DRAFT_398858 [Ochromonadaceae sp. CCMP2298]